MIRSVMELETKTLVENKVYVHYKHTDSCRFARWTARESYQFMYARPWQHILHFYSDLVNGRCSLSDLFGSERSRFIHDNDEIPERNDVKKDGSGRWARLSFKILVSYHGGSFDGWQKQPGLNTVQGLVERSLGSFIDERKAQLLTDKCKPLEGCAVVAGRTDKGVSALKQAESSDREAEIENFCSNGNQTVGSDENIENELINDEGVVETGKKPRSFSVSRVNLLLQQLEGKLFSYKLFARDTKASRNILKPSRNSSGRGPPTECFIYHARAAEVRLPCLRNEQGEGMKVMCVELVANRFLRKMVRVLVATSIREAAAGAEDNALLELMEATCRRATAPPAPPDGLCLVDVGYTDFDPKNSLIA